MRFIGSSGLVSSFSLLPLVIGAAACSAEPSEVPIEQSQAALLGLDADVSATITDQVAEVSPGLATTYRIVVRNAGPLAALSVDVRSVLPSALGQVTWTCTSTGGAACAAAGSGPIDESFAMPAGATATYLLRGVVGANTPLGSMVTASVSTRVRGLLGLLLTDTNPSNDGASDTNLVVAPAQVPSTLVRVSGDGQSAVVPNVLGAPLVVALRDQNGAPIANAPVSFTVSDQNGVPAARLSAGAVFTDAQGSASVQVTLGTVAGAFTVTANAANLTPVSFGLTARAAAPASVSALPRSTPQTVGLSQALGQSLAALVRDRFGNPVPGTQVHYLAPGVGPSAALSASSALTGADGVAAVAATSNATLGLYTVLASVDGVLLPAAFQISNIAGVPVVLSGGDSRSAVAGQPFAALDVGVLTALGAPVVGALVSVDAQAGIEIGGVPTTGLDGRVSIPATAGHVAGDFTVTIRALGGLSPIQFLLHVLPDLPARLTADASSSNQTARVGTGFSQPIAVTLYDQWDNRIPNAPITFVAPVLGAWGQFDANVVATDAQGRASARLTAGVTPGAFQAMAFSPLPLVSAAIGVRASAGAPYSVQVIPTVLPRKAIVETTYEAPLGVHVQDSYGNPVEAAVVRFTPPADGPSAALSERSASTDALGTAQIVATANRTAGTFEVAATADGSLAGVTFGLENLAAAPKQLVLADATTAQSTRIGTAFARPLGLTIRDAFGNPVSGVGVSFAADPSQASAFLTSPAVSDAVGQVSVVATANLVPGAYGITASGVGFDAQARYQLTNLAEAPRRLTLESGGAQFVYVAQNAPVPLVVRLVDGDGAPLANQSLSVTTTELHATATASPAQPTTDADGRAIIALRAGTEAGTVGVTITAEGAEAPVTTTLNVFPPPPPSSSSSSGAVVTEPAAPEASPQETPRTIGEEGLTGGGCSTSGHTSPAPLAWGLGLLALVGLRRRSSV